jgi:hypothetical protein
VAPNARRKARTLQAMRQGDDPALLAALRASSEREREARERLIEARDELNARDERFAALEDELWSRFEERELRAREEADRLREEADRAREEADRAREEADRAREEAVRLRVRLDGIEASAPMRLYARFKHLPGLRRVAERRTRKYEATLQARLRR